MKGRRSATGWIVGAVVVVVVVAAAAWWYFSHVPGLDFTRHEPPQPPPAAKAPPAPIEHPISEAAAGPAPATTTPLPLLADSDKAIAAAVSKLPGAAGLRDLLIAQAVIPHVVATVDALPRRTIGSSIIPLRTPPGTFMVDKSGAQPAIDARNYARYDAYMRVVSAIDTRALVAWYVHWYPLFQQAYRELGYPHGYFNDRLVVAIDDMLAAPNAQPPVALAPMNNGRYALADPTWESLSVGQKLMIRLGPDNERAFKDKLRSIRAALVGESPVPPAAAPAAAASSAPGR